MLVFRVFSAVGILISEKTHYERQDLLNGKDLFKSKLLHDNKK